MSNKFIFLQDWLNKRSARERIYLFCIGFALFYLIYYIFFLKPVLAEKKSLLEKVATFQTQKLVIQQQIDDLNIATKTPTFLQLDAQQKKTNCTNREDAKSIRKP